MGVEVAAAAAFVYGTYKNVESQKKSQQATERSQQASERQYVAETKKAEIQNIRSVRQQIRQSRVAQSSMLNVGAQTGGMGGSGMVGGIASVGSQLGSNLGYMSEIASANTAIGAAALDYSREMGNASIASSEANQYAAVASLGSTVFGAVGGFPKTPPTPTTPQRTG
jgi:Flp pilus assembly protein TadB